MERQFQAGVVRLSGTIERRLDALSPASRTGIPHAVRARALAGALFALLRYWIEDDAPYTPAQMDAMFHAMAASD